MRFFLSMYCGWGFTEAMGVECITIILSNICTCCAQVFLVTFLSSPWLIKLFWPSFLLLFSFWILFVSHHEMFPIEIHGRIHGNKTIYSPSMCTNMHIEEDIRNKCVFFLFFFPPEVITLRRSQAFRNSVCSWAAHFDYKAFHWTSGCSLAPMVRPICRLELHGSRTASPRTASARPGLVLCLHLENVGGCAHRYLGVAISDLLIRLWRQVWPGLSVHRAQTNKAPLQTLI